MGGPEKEGNDKKGSPAEDLQLPEGKRREERG